MISKQGSGNDIIILLNESILNSLNHISIILLEISPFLLSERPDHCNYSAAKTLASFKDF